MSVQNDQQVSHSQSEDAWTDSGSDFVLVEEGKPPPRIELAVIWQRSSRTRGSSLPHQLTRPGASGCRGLSVANTQGDRVLF
jgi:hypothetical protein